jgi:hypothetical protein
MKAFISFILGFSAALALTYFLDPKGSQVKLKKMEKELKKNRKIMDNKLAGYKEKYVDVVDKYAKSTKSMILPKLR